jgi:hypothetical protein
MFNHLFSSASRSDNISVFSSKMSEKVFCEKSIEVKGIVTLLTIWVHFGGE